MDKKKTQIEKQAYEKPMLTKHGHLKDVTAADRLGSKKIGSVLGCTRF